MAVAVLAPFGAVASGQSTFYVSPNGNDLADGLTPATAWRSVDKVSATAFQPGQTVLFERGGEWRGRLSAASSGSSESPITYGAYGSGARPRFYGSDILNKSAFAPLGGSTTAYEVAAPAQVGSVLADGVFFRSAELVTRSADAAVNRNHVQSNPGSWWWDSVGKTLLVNTGTAVMSDPRQLTAVTRDDVVFNNFKSHLVFRDLAADETAFFGRGYAFRVQSGENVRIENSEAYRAGKHHFGVINSTGFVGKGLYATLSMPDQGNGGATALVSYSDFRYSNQTSHWEDVLIEDVSGPYPAWYSHGEGIGEITLRNIVARDTAFTISEKTKAYDIRVINGGIRVQLGGELDGATLSGRGAQLALVAGSTARNVLIDRYSFAGGYPAPVVFDGAASTLEFATVTTDPANPSYSQLIAFANANSIAKIHSSIFSGGTGTFLTGGLVNLSQLESDFNLYHNATIRLPGSGVNLTLAQWAAATGNDLSSLVGVPVFVDPATGNYNLMPQSPGIDAIPFGEFPHVLLDRNGRPRPIGSGYDIGAFEGFAVVPEPSGGLAVLGAGALVLTARRRR